MHKVIKYRARNYFSIAILQWPFSKLIAFRTVRIVIYITL